MEKKNSPDFGRLMSDALQDALRSGDFSQLRRTVNSSINTVVEKTISCARTAEETASHIFGRETPNNSAPGWGPCAWDPSKVQSPPQPPKTSEPPQPPQPPQPPEPPKPPSKSPSPNPLSQTLQYPPYLKKTTRDIILGVLLTIVGFLAGVPIGASAIVLAVQQLPLGLQLGPFVAFTTLCAITAMFGIMISKGIRMQCRAKRFRSYWSQLKKNGFCDIKVLAETIEKSPRYVIRDLTRMLGDSLLPGAKMDDDKTCLIVGEELYNQYRETKENIIQKEQRSQTENEVLAAGMEAIQQIRRANAALPEELISEKLDRLEEVTTNIFSYVEKHPTKLQEIRRFMEYYLPTTIKLVTSYQDFETKPETLSITAAKEEILATLDTISSAFETLLDGLYQDDTLDISTDISALKTMLAQEGLTGNDFEKKEQ